MISGLSDHEEAAYTFASWLSAPAQQREWALGGGYLPTLEELYDDPELLQAPAISAGREAVGNARVRPISPAYSELSPRIARAFNRVLRGEIDGTRAVADLDAELRRIVRRQR